MGADDFHDNAIDRAGDRVANALVNLANVFGDCQQAHGADIKAAGADVRAGLERLAEAVASAGLDVRGSLDRLAEHVAEGPSMTEFRAGLFRFARGPGRELLGNVLRDVVGAVAPADGARDPYAAYADAIRDAGGMYSQAIDRLADATGRGLHGLSLSVEHAGRGGDQQAADQAEAMAARAKGRPAPGPAIEPPPDHHRIDATRRADGAEPMKCDYVHLGGGNCARPYMIAVEFGPRTVLRVCRMHAADLVRALATVLVVDIEAAEQAAERAAVGAAEYAEDVRRAEAGW